VSPARPALSTASGALRAAPRLAPSAKRLLWRSVYEVLSAGRGDLGPTLLNYGYAPLDATGPQPSCDETQSDGLGLQLYAAVAGAAELSGKDVLEVGCGRGGGTAFVFERFAPRSMTGLDLARRAIARCRARYARPGLQFVAGNAESLPFADGTFDAVLSIESTHCYPDPPSFFREVYRVLRPGGFLLLADLRSSAPTSEGVFAREDVEQLRRQLSDAGFHALEQEDITANVTRALELDTPARKARIERRVAKPLRPLVLGFAAVEGSPVHRAFAAHELRYLRFALLKTPAADTSEQLRSQIVVS
jgi:SAM-dependent methyltransferase